MSLQLLMIDTLRIFPKWLLRAFVGPAPLIDGNTLDMNMHVLATLSAKGNKRRAAQSLEDIRAKAAEFEGLNLPLARGVTVEDTSFELLGNTLSARIHRPQNAPENMPAILFFHHGEKIGSQACFPARFVGDESEQIGYSQEAQMRCLQQLPHALRADSSLQTRRLSLEYPQVIAPRDAYCLLLTESRGRAYSCRAYFRQ